MGNKPQDGRIKICAFVGAVVGFATMMILNLTTGVVPGGAIGGAIGGGGGALIGQVLGSAIFNSK